MSETLDVVIPVHAPDIERLTRRCLPSLLRNLSGVHAVSVIVTDGSTEQVRQACVGMSGVRILHAAELVPALDARLGSRRCRAALVAGDLACSLLRRVGRDVRYTPALARRGWFHQQIAKLAYAELTTATHYLAVDADMICARPTTVEELFDDGRPIGELFERIPPSQQAWYGWARSLLGLTDGPARALAMPPLVFIAGEVRAMVDEVLRVAPDQWVPDLVGRLAFGGGPGDPGYRWQRLLLMLPWTEYALYHTYLHARRSLGETYALESPLRLSGRAVWSDRDLERWVGIEQAAIRERFVFTLVQPTVDLSAEVLFREFPWLAEVHVSLE